MNLSLSAARGKAARRVGRAIGYRRDEAAAVVEFALVSVVLISLLFAVLQVAVYAYVRHVVIADAANAARYAAASGVPADAAPPRAAALISSHLGASTAHGLTCRANQTVDAPSGLEVISVRCRGSVRSIFLPVGTFLTIDIATSALKEPPS